MKKYILTYLLVSGCLLFPGCADRLEESTDAADYGSAADIRTKVANTPERPVEGMLLVCLDSHDAIEPADSRFHSVNIKSVEPAFNVTEKNAARLARFGLDKWYVVRFDGKVGLSDAAMTLASADEVRKVQFNNRGRLTDAASPAPVSGAASVQPAQSFMFDDPLLSGQWHYLNDGNRSLAPSARAGADINVKDAWGLTGGDPDIIVAIVDEAVKYSHPDLEPNMWVNEKELNGTEGVDDDGNGFVDDIYGYNFVTDGPLSWDNEKDTGHGTHVAGTVAAVNNNGIGVCGVAGGTGNGDGVRLMSCQIFADESGGDDLSCARAVVYAADNGASILQVSSGYDAGMLLSDEEFMASCPLYYNALMYFLKYGGGNLDGNTGDVLDGGLVIYAAGNEAMDISGYPAAFKDFISVTSVGPDYLPAYYTNYGQGCNIAAPGGDAQLSAEPVTQILSTMPSEITDDGSDYGYMQGTSMACPHVSGVAALGLSYAKKLGKKFTREEFTSMLLTSVNDLEYYLDGEKDGMNLYLYRGQMGTGLVDAWKLLMQIEGTPCVTVPVGKEALVDLSTYFGGGAASLDYTGLEMSDDAKSALGVEGEPSFKYGKLAIKCTEYGSAKLKVTADVAGMQVTKTVSLVSRGAVSSNGGWL